jgi:glycosyltransferase involved in cell wall biosynthesis/SAM-dependent methyltransferase
MSDAIGVNVAGFLRGALGLGEAARLYVAALQEAGIPVSTTTVDVPLPDTKGAVPKEADFQAPSTGGELPFNLICVNAPEMPSFYEDVGPQFFEGKRSIGVYAWEVDHVPAAWSWAFDLVDEIWTYSSYVADILRGAAPNAPVARVPLPVRPPAPAGPAPDLGLPDKFTFLFLFDFYSTLQRKNPLGLIEAFKRAFRPGEGPQLLVKSFNGDYKPERLELVQAAAAEHPDVHVVDRYLSTEDRDALVAGCDCYVSLHRSEGFGLTLAEALARGKPVVATRFGGNTDFMTDENSFLVDYTLARVGKDGENYPPDGRWADPDLDHAAELMRSVYEGRDAARARATAGGPALLERLSLDRVGGIAKARLERLAARGPARRTPPSPPPVHAWDPIQRAEWKLEFDPLRDAREAGGAKGAARAAALQAMRPYTYHQDELNQALVDGLKYISDRLQRFEREGGLDADGWARLRQLIEAARTRPAPEHPLISGRDEYDEPVLAFDAESAEAAPADAYAGFEDVFRGSEELVRGRQRGYVESFEGTGWVLDLGCGRGEFLDLLKEAGIRGAGVDSDEGMVARSRAKGHEVEQADALEHLRGLDDRSVPGMFAAQFVEHLPPDPLFEFLRVAAVKLAPGGTAVFETVNPHVPSAMKAFWVDPTHHHPLFPEVLLALCRFAGFGAGRVVFPDAGGSFTSDLFSSPDYAVVLRGRAAESGQ